MMSSVNRFRKCWRQLVALPLIGVSTLALGGEFPCVGNFCLPFRRNAEPKPDLGSAPIDDEPEEKPQVGAAPANGPLFFAAPSPTGEISGARRSYELPSFRMTLPRLALESPEFRLNGGTQIRRDPRMQLDSATAGVASGPPAVFGQVMGASVQNPQPSPQVGGAPLSDPPKKTGAAPIECAPGCTQAQSEEVQHLTQQVKELQGLLLQLAEQQAAGQQATAESDETLEEDQPAPEVSYVPRKAKMVSNSRHVTTSPVRNATQRESLAASQRLQRLQEILEEKQAEMEALQAEQEEVEAAEREEIKAEERRLAARKKQLEADRVARLRSRMGRESVTEEPIASRASMIERMNYEDEAVEEQTPEPVAPKQLMPKPSRLKAVPTSSIRRNPSEWHEAEER